MINDDRELNWLAFQYIAGELTTEAAAGFEDRLAVNQEAREAVAQALELAEVTAIAAVRPVEPATGKSPKVSPVVWTRRLAWMACGAAACLLLVVLVQQAGTDRFTARNHPAGNERLVPGSRASNVDSPELALAWAQARSSVSVADAVDTGAVEAGAVEAGAVEAGAVEAGAVEAGAVEARTVDGVDSDDNANAAPSWMLVAIAGLTVGVEEFE